MKPTVFCLIPVKDEEWIIERALQSASIWADKIIVSDQGSTDRTIEIVKRFEKVILIDNSQLKDFNEKSMRKPLFDEARKTPGKRLLISLDADEIFTPNFDSLEWQTMLNAEEGTRFTFELCNIRPGFKDYFTTINLTCAFMDDGQDYDVGLIHVPRQPYNPNAKNIYMNDIAVIHFQFLNWKRMERKQLWYQMYERIHYPKKSIITIFRNFHYNRNFIAVNYNWRLLPVKDFWKDIYSSRYNIEITSIVNLPNYIWDKKMIEYISDMPNKYFNRIDIWSIDWNTKIKGLNVDTNKFKDNRNFIDKLLLTYLKRTNPYRIRFIVRFIDRILKIFF